MSADTATATATEVTIPVGDAALVGSLVVPEQARGLVVFAHGSGSSRHSPRNRRVASVLHGARIGTLLLDLLTVAEDDVDGLAGEHRFDIDLLARRLIDAIGWLRSGPFAALPVGLFGASTGAAAALVAAAERPEARAVVSRGGRPDLAGSALRRVRAPTLLIVGGADTQVLELNRRALDLLGAAKKQLVVVPGASHLFEEPGALDHVARLAAHWFSDYLPGADGTL